MQVHPDAARQERCRRLDQRFARPMFALSLLSLGGLAILLHFHEREEYLAVWTGSLVMLMAIWPVYLLEFAWSWQVNSPRTRERLWCCLLPPLRLAARDHETGQRLWLPGWDWQPATAELQARLERASHVPMILVALLVLPLIGLEYQFADRIEANVSWASAVAAATAVIWFTFTLEFVVMFSLAEKKLAYLRQHWMDLAIILLPLVAFLRALRLGRLLRLQQVTRTARVYRLRGVAMRAWRALLVLEVVQRLLQGTPQRRLQRLDERIAETQRELEALLMERRHLETVLSAAEPTDPGLELRPAA